MQAASTVQVTPENGWQPSERLKGLGFRFGPGGTHITRTMMLDEIGRLLAAVPYSAPADVYRDAVIEKNLLGKATESTRHRTYRHLRELYALRLETPLFRLYRHLAAFDPQSLPLLSLLVAWARDPQLRATTDAVLPVRIDSAVTVADIGRVLTNKLAGQYNAQSIFKIAKNASSSWTQSGHLVGRVKKTRSRVHPRAVTLALALFLADASDIHGAATFSSVWCRLLDLSSSEARSLAAQAHREGLLTLKTIGAVVEMSFPRFGELMQEGS